LRVTGLDWDIFCRDQEVLISMRFSFFGVSGWKSDSSRDEALLLAPDRLRLRLALLRRLPLPSLAAQTDRNFHLFILTSASLPDWAEQELVAACEEVLPDQVTIYLAPPDRAAEFLRQALVERYGKARNLHMVLDDDDALSTDFIAKARGDMGSMGPISTDDEYRFLSYAKGYGLNLMGDDVTDPTFFVHKYPFINLGLTMSAPNDRRNLFAISHRNGPRRHPHRLLDKQPMFVRSLNGSNDSRVAISKSWKPVVDWQSNPDINARFSYLLAS
jgi:Putative rhamnosyl transferase